MKKRGINIKFKIPNLKINFKNFKPSLKNISINGKASFLTLAFVYIYLICEIVYKVKISKEICTWEIVMLFLVFSVYGIFNKLFSKAEIPLDFNGNPLTIGTSKRDKKKRNSFYIKSALIYSAVFAIVNTIAFWSSSTVNFVNIAAEFFDKDISNFSSGLIFSLILFPIVYIFAYMIEYVWNEYKISAYNAIQKVKAEEALLKAQEKEKAEKEALEKEKELINEMISIRIEELKAKKTTTRKTKTAKEIEAKETDTVSPPVKRRGRPPKNTATTSTAK